MDAKKLREGWQERSQEISTEVILKRRYLSCPHCGYSFFPLDKEVKGLRKK